MRMRVRMYALCVLMRMRAYARARLKGGTERGRRERAGGYHDNLRMALPLLPLLLLLLSTQQQRKSALLL